MEQLWAGARPCPSTQGASGVCVCLARVAVGQEGPLPLPRAPCPGRLAGQQLPEAPATSLFSPAKSLRFDK